MDTAVSTTTNGFLRRVVGAAALDPSVYEEVEADRGATGQALLVVVLSSLAAGVGARGFGATGVSSVAFFGIVALMAWATWALVAFEVGVRLLPQPQTRADVGELLRTTGFAAAPGMLQVFGLLPGLTGLVFVATWVWMLAAMVLGVRQALDFTTVRRAVLVCVFGMGVALVFAVVLGFFFGPRVS
jgi:hypothetical protein